MKVYKLFYILFRIRLLTPLALFRLVAAIYRYGINLMALLSFSATTYGSRIAFVDERNALTYRELFIQSEELSAVMREQYKLKRGMKVGLLCYNHASLVKAIFAVSMTGADVYLLNVEMSEGQLYQILERNRFALLVYDEERGHFIEQSSHKQATLLSYHDTLPAINNLHRANHNIKGRYRNSTGKLVLLTGGTTGKAKEAAHKPSLFNYLDPFYDFLTRLRILDNHTAYIATPIYHGYGIAVLLLFSALGKKVVVRRGFDAQKACDLIREHQVEVVTVVPLMLRRMLKTNAADLKSLTCIASGGAELSPKLAEQTLSQLGEVLYNLYGTSEAGLNIIATPQDLSYSAHTIGRKIKGVHLTIRDEHKDEVAVGQVGQLCINNSWSMNNVSHNWIETGDLGYCDEKGYYFLCGRSDNMIVSGGENVYPLEVEQVLLTHPDVEDAAVIGMSDEQFGQRLKAFVQIALYKELTHEELIAWLRPRLARYQLPKEISFVDLLPYTPLGKLDKKQLI
ncbi:MAG: AMP-binding protein [Candidatus Cohnella colombiensis]|uniref:AMP-binding protein n=1 Tax=Candidatus Cohnella colombiensis TaxID=3121368 RepID=A0AA95EWD2_9BACL|nr:MAG: AMP-binding protein [Cohnella sp.]